MSSSSPKGPSSPTAVDLYWLPLGAHGCSVRSKGRVFEAYAARRQKRPARELCIAVLEVTLGSDRFVIETTPVRSDCAAHDGALQGPMWGLPARLGRSPLLRYEVRRSSDCLIPEDPDAASGPRCVGRKEANARNLLGLVPQIPDLTWGRDQLGAGDAWNSNLMVAWLLGRSGHHVRDVVPPPRCRAPGWAAGLALARARADHPPLVGRVTSYREAAQR